MLAYVDLWNEATNYVDCVRFLKRNKESSNRDIIEKYNIEAIPTFLFIKNNEQVAPPYTALGVQSASKQIETIINDLLKCKK